MMVKVEPQLLGVKEVALRLRCSEQTVRRRISEGSLPALRLGDGPRSPLRIDRAEFERWLYGLDAPLFVAGGAPAERREEGPS
jgi:excisionase family DNA binding protein